MMTSKSGRQKTIIIIIIIAFRTETCWKVETKPSAKTCVRHLCEITTRVNSLSLEACRNNVFVAELSALQPAWRTSTAPPPPLTSAFAAFCRLIWLIVFSPPSPRGTCVGMDSISKLVFRSGQSLKTRFITKTGPKCISIFHLQSLTLIIKGCIVEWNLLCVSWR